MKPERVIALLGILLLLTTSATSLNIVNSEDWEDVYSGIIYSNINGENVRFAMSPTAAGLIKKAPKGEPVTILQSEENPVSSNLQQRLESNGFNVEETRRFQNLNTGLMGSQENLIVVPRDYPSAAIASAPIARKENSWVIVVEDGEIEEIRNMMEQAENSILVGDFQRDILEQLEPVANEKIIDPNRFNLSVKLAKRFIGQKDGEVKRAYLSSGKFLESDMLKGNIPVLLSGTNLISGPIEKYLLREPEHSIDTLILIGNEMTSVGQEVRDRKIVRNGEEKDEKYSVFVKYGTARGDSSRTYALSLYPIPQEDYQLEIGSVRYDPEKREMYISYRNTGQNRMYLLSNLRITADGENIDRVSDSEPVFVGGESEKTVTYRTNINTENYRNASVEFSTTYGESPSNLDTYLTESGRFSPPVTKPLKIEQINQESNVSLESAVYMKDMNAFRLSFRNKGDEESYVRATLRDVEVNGERRSFETDLEKIPPEGTKQLHVRAELDQIDLEENQRLEIVWNQGDSKQVQPIYNREVMKLETSERNLIGSFTDSPGTAAGAVIVVAILIVSILRREKLFELFPKSFS